MVDRAALLDRLHRMETELKCLGVGSLYLFGSRARGDHRPDSDVDLLYDVSEGDVDYWRLLRVRDDLAAAFELPVDLVERSRLHALMRPFVEPDLVRVF